MTFKSASQPLCRHCGGKIKKHTHPVCFGQRVAARGVAVTYVTATPASRALAQTLVTATIVSMKWAPAEPVSGARFIASVSTWDGESYADAFFCTGTHARAFAYALARAGHQTTAHQRAVAAAQVEPRLEDLSHSALTLRATPTRRTAPRETQTA